jgi:4-amino-4-deoxy-L-arabinose transferase-like glycosyltransferase
MDCMGLNAGELTRRPAETAGDRVSDTAYTESTEQRFPLRTALLICFFGTLTAALYAFVIYPRQGMIEAAIDVNGFGLLGRHLAAGDGFSLGDGPTVRRAPLYPAFVALLLRLFGNTGPEQAVYRPVIAAQCLMVGLTCLTAWAVTRKLFGNRPALFAGILCAITPQVLRYVGMTEVETAMGLLITLMTLTGLNLSRRLTVRNGVLFGLAVAAASLVKFVAVLYPVVLGAALLLRSLHAKKRSDDDNAVSSLSARPLPALAAAAVTLLLCLLPWSIRNMIVTHGRFKGISSNGAGEFLRGYVNAQPKFAFLHQDFGGSHNKGLIWDMEANLYEDALLRRYGVSLTDKSLFGPSGPSSPQDTNINVELIKDKVEGAEVKRLLLHEPLGFLRKFAIQVFTFWYIVETRKKSLLVGGIALAALALGGYGWIRARRRGIDVFPVVSVIIYFNLIYAVFLAFARYSMPVFPTLLVMTAYGLDGLVPARRVSH